MLLRHLVLENIRSIKHLEMDFVSPADDSKLRQWTLLLGQNGTGKSTVLKAIGLLLAGTESLAPLLVDVGEWIREGANEAVIKGVLQTKEGEQRPIALKLRRGMKTWDVIKANQDDLEALDRALAHTPRNYFVVAYGASRRLPGGSLAMSQRSNNDGNPRARAMASLFTPDAALNSLEDWAVDLDYRKGEEGLEIIRAGLKGLLPGTALDRIDKEKKQLLFKTADGVVPLSRLSDGYQNMAAWCGDLLYRITSSFDDYKQPLNCRGLLLIDEIDLHLHPVWQRQLISFLNKKLPNFQIVATTHSPLTAQQAGASELHLLERKTARSAPQLRRFDGIPREMRIEDLVISPWFGLESGYSLKVEKAKQEYLELRKETAKAPKTGIKASAAAASAGTDRKRLADLESQLAAVTTPRPASAVELQNREVLQKLDAVLGKIGKGKAR